MAARPPGSYRIEVDPEQLRSLAAALRELQGGARLQRRLRTNLRAAAEPAAAQVRANAAGFSSRIPAAVAVRVAFTSRRPGVSIVVNRVKAPHARPIENDGKQGTFLHPVFGRTPAVAQFARPFFFNQLEQQLPRVERAVLDALDGAARELGWT